MSGMSAKDRNLLLVLIVAVLYGFAAMVAKAQLENWKKARKTWLSTEERLANERALIAAGGDWRARYDEVCDLMPMFSYERDVATHWLNMMDSVASDNGLTISRRQTGKEVEIGDVYELPIECKDWEGPIEPLVRFLYDLNAEGAMLDIRQLYVRPSNKPGFLKGSFTLSCAYMRGDVVSGPASAPVAESAVADDPTAEGEQGEVDMVVEGEELGQPVEAGGSDSEAPVAVESPGSGDELPDSGV